jgi:uncharacterized membrane protein
MGYSVEDGGTKSRDLVVIVHALNLCSCFVGFTGLVAIIIAYLKRDEMAGSIWEGHMTFAIRTFWIGLLAGFIGGLLTFIGIGLLILLAVFLWYLVRTIFALLKAVDRKPIPNPDSFLI